MPSYKLIGIKLKIPRRLSYLTRSFLREERRVSQTREETLPRETIPQKVSHKMLSY